MWWPGKRWSRSIRGPIRCNLSRPKDSWPRIRRNCATCRVDYERFKLLFQEGVIPKQQLDTQQAQVGTLEGAIKADTRRLITPSSRSCIADHTAPISGRVGLRLVDMGNMVHAAATNGLLVITQLQPIATLFSLPQDQLPQVMARMKKGAPIVVEAYDRDNTTKLATGKLLTIDNQIDTTTGTYKLKALVDNTKNELFPNQFVNVHLLVDTEEKCGTCCRPLRFCAALRGLMCLRWEADNKVKIHVCTLAEANGNITGISSG